VTAKKLGRRYAGVEIESEYCQMAVKRLTLAKQEESIQGYQDGCFWERNSLNDQKKSRIKNDSMQKNLGLFDE